ncbi:M56 family metallopeptidase [Pedobacter panaciterrae]
MEQILNTVLLYSLALGLILALLTGLTLLLTRSASPLLRYRILVTLLALFTASIAVTVVFKLCETNPTTSAFNRLIRTPQVTTDFRKAGINNTINTETTDLIASSRDFMNDNARTITLIWLFIVFAKSIKLTSNLFELHYLKTRQVYPAGKHWEDQLARLSGQMGLSKAVRIMQSGLTQVPLVIGHFKPVILIPWE